jgi:hypothetical protein
MPKSTSAPARRCENGINPLKHAGGEGMAMLRDNWIVIAIGVAVIAALTLLIW